MYNCGCSWSTPDKRVPGTHFSELVANALDWEAVHLAMPGARDKVISLQIDEARKHKPDLVLIGFWGLYKTVSDGFEIPYKSNPGVSDNISLKHFNRSLMPNGLGYEEPTDDTYMLTVNSGMLDEAPYKHRIRHELHDFSSVENADQLMDEFADYRRFTDVAWDRYIDIGVLYTALDKLYNAKIPFLVISKDHSYIDNDRLPKEWFLNITIPSDRYVPIYHTDPQAQIPIANTILETIEKLGLNS